MRSEVSVRKGSVMDLSERWGRTRVPLTGTFLRPRQDPATTSEDGACRGDAHGFTASSPGSAGEPLCRLEQGNAGRVCPGDLQRSRSTRPSVHTGAIAQLVERCNRTAEVRGSNPLSSTPRPPARTPDTAHLAGVSLLGIWFEMQNHASIAANCPVGRAPTARILYFGLGHFTRKLT